MERDESSGMIITYAGEDFAALRSDQQEYVQHLMLSWRQHGPMMMYHRQVLDRAIKKAKEQRP